MPLDDRSSARIECGSVVYFEGQRAQRVADGRRVLVDSIEECAQALVALLNDRNRARELARRGREHFPVPPGHPGPCATRIVLNAGVHAPQ